MHNVLGSYIVSDVFFFYIHCLCFDLFIKSLFVMLTNIFEGESVESVVVQK